MARGPTPAQIQARDKAFSELYDAHQKRIAPLEEKHYAKIKKLTAEIDREFRAIRAKENRLEAELERKWKEKRKPLIARFKKEMAELKKIHGW